MISLLQVALLMTFGGCRSGHGSPQAAVGDIALECADATREVPLPANLRDSLTATLALGTGRSIDDFFATVAREYAGGFGGTYIEDGRHVLRFTDTTAARANLGPINARLAAYFSNAFDSGAVRLASSQWSFAVLYDWYRYIQPRLFGRGGVHMSDVDEARNRLTFTVRDASQIPGVRAAIEALGVPCGLVVLRVESVQVIPLPRTR